mmetsp:Transcript_54061/g.143921  ORF Transcript_54061/g.143921 Transcript_54061/m.143921 type:complete len:267 (-) Transcript_54061:109-909(-)
MQISAGNQSQANDPLATDPSLTADAVLMDKHEVMMRLRELGQPITIFGESDVSRFQRLAKIEAESVDRENIGLEDRKKKNDEEAAPEDNPANEDEEEDEGERYPGDGTGFEDVIRKWVRKILKSWESDLNARAEEDKTSASGRHETGQYRQSRQFLKPLMKRLKKRNLDVEIRDMLREMVLHCHSQEYVKANDVYMLLSVGRSPHIMSGDGGTPMMETARTTVFVAAEAHIMHDETTRKYIQTFKRLITYVQKKWPTDPSRMVAFA